MAVERAVESAVRMASNEIRHRANPGRHYAKVPPVQGNEARLGQVFLNLIVNAAQAIPEGHAAENRIDISIQPGDSERVVIEARDNGSGIAPETLARIFDPFYTTKPAGVGTGLGLAICHRIVTGSAGTSRSRGGRGRARGFAWHCGAPPNCRRRRWSPPQHAATQRGRVLAMDDEPMLCATVERVLPLDREVSAVMSAQRALQTIEQGERFDVILPDLMMPQMTGMELHAAVMRVLPEQARKMVFMTGGAFSPDAAAFLERISNPTIGQAVPGERVARVGPEPVAAGSLSAKGSRSPTWPIRGRAVGRFRCARRRTPSSDRCAPRPSRPPASAGRTRGRSLHRNCKPAGETDQSRVAQERPCIPPRGESNLP